MPDLERAKAACGDPFTVYQDAYYPTEAAYAHVLLPAASGENWTMTNSERVVTLCPAFRLRQKRRQMGDIRRSRPQVGLY